MIDFTDSLPAFWPKIPELEGPMGNGRIIRRCNLSVSEKIRRLEQGRKLYEEMKCTHALNK